MDASKTKEIYLDGRRVEYVLKTSLRARNLRITVRPGGMITAVRPRNLPEKAVEDFLRRKSIWVLRAASRLEGCQNFLALGTRADFKKNAPAARQLVLKKLAEFNNIYNVGYKRVAIRNQATRWGSCSRQGNLNFNYRIALLPENLSDYIIVHEMCHLREMNHSRRFWDLVAVALPDYAKLRQQLRRDFS